MWPSNSHRKGSVQSEPRRACQLSRSSSVNRVVQDYDFRVQNTGTAARNDHYGRLSLHQHGIQQRTQPSQSGRNHRAASHFLHFVDQPLQELPLVLPRDQFEVPNHD